MLEEVGEVRDNFPNVGADYKGVGMAPQMAKDVAVARLAMQPNSHE